MTNGAGNPAMNGIPMSHPNGAPHPGHPQQLSSGHVTALNSIAHQVHKQHPNLSPGSVQNMATQQLRHQVFQHQAQQQQQQQQQRQSALNAAAGTAATGFNGQMNPSAYLPPNMAGGGSPQLDQQQLQYRQMLQRSGSQFPSSPSMNQVRPASRSATPQGMSQQGHHQRAGSNSSLQGSPGMM